MEAHFESAQQQREGNAMTCEAFREQLKSTLEMLDCATDKAARRMVYGQVPNSLFNEIERLKSEVVALVRRYAIWSDREQPIIFQHRGGWYVITPLGELERANYVEASLQPIEICEVAL